MAESEIISVGIIGAAGRMGRALVGCLHSFPGLRLAGAVEEGGCAAVGGDAGTVAGIGATGITVARDISEISEVVDVLVDFSAPASSAAHALVAAERKKGLVIGTTGLDGKQEADVRKAAESVAVVWAPNMSKGVNLLFDIVEKAAAVLDDYDVEIVETHHRHKKDAPSGTALRLVEAAAAARARDPAAVMACGRSGQTGERPAAQIGVHALRAGDVVGDHTVVLASDGERIELTHRATSRDCFAMGALRAAEWVFGRSPGLYTMQDVLELSG